MVSGPKINLLHTLYFKDVYLQLWANPHVICFIMCRHTVNTALSHNHKKLNFLDDYYLNICLNDSMTLELKKKCFN